MKADEKVDPKSPAPRKADLKSPAPKKAGPAKKTQEEKAEKENNVKIPTVTRSKSKKVQCMNKPPTLKLIELGQLSSDDSTGAEVDSPKTVRAVESENVENVKTFGGNVKKAQMKKTAPQAKSSAQVLSSESEEEEKSSKNENQVLMSDQRPQAPMVVFKGHSNKITIVFH